MQLIDTDVNKAIEILDKMQFFGGQRAGRELWAAKPKEVQDADLESFNIDVEFLRKVVLSKIENTIIDAEPVRHGRWINPHLNKYGHPCHQCNQCLFVASQKDRNFCPDCGAKMDLEE